MFRDDELAAVSRVDALQRAVDRLQAELTQERAENDRLRMCLQGGALRAPHQRSSMACPSPAARTAHQILCLRPARARRIRGNRRRGRAGFENRDAWLLQCADPRSQVSWRNATRPDVQPVGIALRDTFK